MEIGIRGSVIAFFRNIFVISCHSTNNSFHPEETYRQIYSLYNSLIPLHNSTDVSVNSTRVHFYLYNPDGETKKDKLVQMNNNGRVWNDIWKYESDIKVIIHGYWPLSKEKFIDVLEYQGFIHIANEYSSYRPWLNIIFPDWTSMAGNPDYAEAMANTKVAGEKVASFLISLKVNQAFSNWKQVHIIGYSLGCPTAGRVGWRIHKFTNRTEKLARISGIDPAGPASDTPEGKAPSDLKGFLEKSDANFVDIIHCNMGKHYPMAVNYGRYGSSVQAGHADFYPNGGHSQRYQCAPQQDETACSHRVCVTYYALSIKQPKLACPFSSWGKYTRNDCECDEETGEYMGEHCSRNASGKYYLWMKTNITELQSNGEKGQENAKHYF